MAVFLDAVGRTRQHGPAAWTSADALLYAVSVGAGASDADDELAFTTENSFDTEQLVLPTFAVAAGSRGAGGGGGAAAAANPLAAAGDFPMTRVLHGGQGINLQAGLPPSGAVMVTTGITAILDKGKNAVIESATLLHDKDTRALIAELTSSVVVLGEGGFGGDPGAPMRWALPDRPPDAVQEYVTRPEQALLFRLNGDRNPLHSDPWFARKAGFERPILHGLCTYGFTGRALLHRMCAGDPAAFGSMSARFASPVLPGDTLAVRMWTTDDGALFTVTVGDRTVLDRGTFRWRH